MKIRILHLDDDPFFTEQLSSSLLNGSAPCVYEVEQCLDVDSYYEKLEDFRPEVVILDISIGETFLGDKLAAETRVRLPEAVIFMCSNLQDIDAIKSCIQAGADDFIFKSGDLKGVSERIYGNYLLKKPRLDQETVFTGVGEQMRSLMVRVPRIINSAITAVHVYGESGTGKELVSNLFEQALPKNTPFVRINCGAISESLLESELFGHVKGAFTGADKDKTGLLQAADGGWVFLDEIASLSDGAQVSLLRALENKTIRKVGSTNEVPIQLKVLSATNENIEGLVQKGKFRGDLWQRICETRISLKPLRERLDEIKELIKFFCESLENGPYNITESAVEILESYDWRQGNVRELRNCLRAMTELNTEKLLTPLSVPQHIWEKLEDTNEPLESQKKSPQNAYTNNDQILLNWGSELVGKYDFLCKKLLLEILNIEFRKNGKLSLRSLSTLTGVPKSTLSTRLKDLVYEGLVDMDELNKMIGNRPVKDGT